MDFSLIPYTLSSTSFFHFELSQKLFFKRQLKSCNRKYIKKVDGELEELIPSTVFPDTVVPKIYPLKYISEQNQRLLAILYSHILR